MNKKIVGDRDEETSDLHKKDLFSRCTARDEIN